MENFILQQEIEQLTHKNLIQNNDNLNLRSELESRKNHIFKLESMLKNKEKSYDDLKRHMSDMQFQMDKIRRSKGDYSVSPYDFKFGGSR